MTSYAVITPARDEAENLPRLAASLAGQTRVPTQWVIVDNGSTDGTRGVADALAERYDWVTPIGVPGDALAVRGSPIVRSLQAGLDALTRPPDVVVNVDADISVEPGYFEQLLTRFADDRRLGIASGSALELDRGLWRRRHVTGSSVWGASRAYRWDCLQDVLPLEERLGWDGIDELKANARGWRTATFTDVVFRHHRREGVRDRGRLAPRVEQGRLAHYMGYRPSYLAARVLFRALKDPAALALLWGFAEAAVRRRPRLADPDAREYLRRQQALRRLPLRAREALGRH